jgi:hypothetical protein
MTTEDQNEDVQAIKNILARQLEYISWSASKDSNWTEFSEDFLPDATLFGAARPARSQTVAAFVDRMKSLSQTGLKSFEQTMLGAEVHVFGSVAIAFGVCRNLENRTDENRGIEAYLMVKDDGIWRIASQTWDTENDSQKIPDYLIAKSM